ncbi:MULTISPECIES: hypothetical protein [unclassified Halomonas]|uniref:hypothetical protein n=1 Tax=unclassified Halomonas TaxID=2609666 RepID=UPI0007D8E423|nr:MULTISPECIES: hypothetical protein [unclassified Halomonas]MBT2787865.1 hypothetical protein [Halomonas sp. ISL-106]MBT2795614.1 hypothetical protein [Halomonas sp. ISL-104]OAL60923.1 hypothetical protein A6R74_14990 [Halomonas sp. ALS9]
MPPLLPEYLSQTFYVLSQVTIEAPTPSADLWSVIIGACATVFGAAFGAGLGAKYAYNSTVRANNDLLKRQKLEEAIFLLFDLEDQVRTLKVETAGLSEDGVKPSRVASWFKAEQGINHDAALKIKVLLEIYENGLCVELVSAFEEFIKAINVIDNDKFVVSQKHGCIHAIESFLEQIGSIKNRLISELKLQ